MRRCAIIGGETHIEEVTALSGKSLEIVGVCVRGDQRDWAQEQFDAPVTDSVTDLLRSYTPDLVAVANENDMRTEVIVAALDAGCDLIVDKPLAITSDGQRAIVDALDRHPDARILNLLTLRGNPPWCAARDVVRDGAIGAPVFCHIRMAVRLKREQRPDWFLDVRRSGGLFLDLLIHGLDMVEWTMESRITHLTAATGNLGYPEETHLRDHASVYCELESGATAIVEGQRMLPDTKGSDYRMTVAATGGVVDLDMGASTVTVTNTDSAGSAVQPLPEKISVVADWLANGTRVPQDASLRANHLALCATESSVLRQRVAVDG